MMDDLLCLAGLRTVYVRTQKNNLAQLSRVLFSHILRLLDLFV